MSFCGVSRTSTFIFVSLIFFFSHNITKWKRQFWFNYQWARISLTIVSVISIQTWPGAAFQLQPKRFQNQPRPGRVGREGHGSVSVQCGLDLPDEPALLLTPRTWKKTEWFISFFIFYRLHHSRKCFCQLAAFLQSFLLWWVVVCPKNWLAIDSKYAFLCWKSFFFKMTFLYY